VRACLPQNDEGHAHSRSRSRERIRPGLLSVQSMCGCVVRLHQSPAEKFKINPARQSASRINGQIRICRRIKCVSRQRRSTGASIRLKSGQAVRRKAGMAAATAAVRQLIFLASFAVKTRSAGRSSGADRRIFSNLVDLAQPCVLRFGRAFQAGVRLLHGCRDIQF
jgi:hypothetical protein